MTSSLVQRAISLAPEWVRSFFTEMSTLAETLEVSPAALDLQDAYLHAKIVSQKQIRDALHVALATVSHCNLIVSWNFKHIVHYQKISFYNAVNTLNGYGQINIFSPLEVIDYDN